MTLTTLSLAKLSECYTDVQCHLLACETYYCCVVEGHLRLQDQLRTTLEICYSLA